MVVTVQYPGLYQLRVWRSILTQPWLSPLMRWNVRDLLQLTLQATSGVVKVRPKLAHLVREGGKKQAMTPFKLGC